MYSASGSGDIGWVVVSRATPKLGVIDNGEQIQNSARSSLLNSDLALLHRELPSCYSRLSCEWVADIQTSAKVTDS